MSRPLSRLSGLSFWQPDNPFALNLYVFQHSRERPDVVILGSSRARMGILPPVIERTVCRETGMRLTAFNLAQLGSGIRTSHRILRDILSMRKPPRFLVLEVFPGQFNSDSLFLNNTYFKYFASQLDILFSLDRRVLGDGMGPRACGLVRDASNLIGLATRNPTQQRYRNQLEFAAAQGGAFPLPTAENMNRLSHEELARLRQMGDVGARHVDWFQPEDRYTINGAADRAFRDSLSLCKKQGIQMLVISLPILGDPEQPHGDRNYEQFIEYITETCDREQVKFRDLQDKVVLQKGDYWDASHVNKNGALIISEYVADEILLPEMTTLREESLPPCNSPQ
jgi:hypothetical protein